MAKGRLVLDVYMDCGNRETGIILHNPRTKDSSHHRIPSIMNKKVTGQRPIRDTAFIKYVSGPNQSLLTKEGEYHIVGYGATLFSKPVGTFSKDTSRNPGRAKIADCLLYILALIDHSDVEIRNLHLMHPAASDKVLKDYRRTLNGSHSAMVDGRLKNITISAESIDIVNEGVPSFYFALSKNSVESTGQYAVLDIGGLTTVTSVMSVAGGISQTYTSPHGGVMSLASDIIDEMIADDRNISFTSENISKIMDAIKQGAILVKKWKDADSPTDQDPYMLSDGSENKGYFVFGESTSRYVFDSHFKLGLAKWFRRLLFDNENSLKAYSQDIKGTLVCGGGGAYLQRYIDAQLSHQGWVLCPEYAYSNLKGLTLVHNKEFLTNHNVPLGSNGKAYFVHS